MGKLSATRRLVFDAMLMALYVILAKLTIPIQGIRITLAPLPIVFASLFFLPYDACMVAGLGEFIIQMTGSYGLTPTTPLWILPPILRAIFIALPAWLYRRKEDRLENHIVIYFVVILFSALITTLANTGVWFLDAYIMEYPYPYTLITTVIRGVVGILTAIVVGALCLPLSRVMKKIIAFKTNIKTRSNEAEENKTEELDKEKPTQSNSNQLPKINNRGNL